jgi:hypothetical protein
MSLQRGQVWSSGRRLVALVGPILPSSSARWTGSRRRGSRSTSSSGGAWPRPLLPAQVMMRPCKKLRYHGGKTVPVFLFDGTILTPVRELLRLFRVDRVPREAYATTPLFRRSSSDRLGRPLPQTTYARSFGSLCALLGFPRGMYGGHSLRIGGASAALAANVSEAIIRAMGRWDSDVFELSTCGVRFRAPGPDGLDYMYHLNFLRGLRAFEAMFKAMFDHEEFVRY